MHDSPFTAYIKESLNNISCFKVCVQLGLRKKVHTHATDHVADQVKTNGYFERTIVSNTLFLTK